MTTCAITGGRDRHPTLVELAKAAQHLHPGAVLRDGDCPTGTDRYTGKWASARCGTKRDPWPADWSIGRKAGPLRNGLMLDGAGVPVEKLIAFAGGRGTADCVKQARERGIEVVELEPVEEPRVWNRHHGRPVDPSGKLIGPLVYVGGNSRDPSKASPLANPFRLAREFGESRPEAADRILRAYKRWLWSRLDGPGRDPAVVETIERIAEGAYLVCSCWPARGYEGGPGCHAEIIVRAWRWMHGRPGNASPRLRDRTTDQTQE